MMKNILVTLIFLLGASTFIFGNRNDQQIVNPKGFPDTTILSTILSLPLQNYMGKPVDSLLNVLPAAYSERGFMTAKVGRAKGVWQAYFTTDQNSCSVEIYVDTFQYMHFLNYRKSTDWDMTLAKKEIISFIKVLKINDSICVYGCNNSIYYW